jgi:hypothetical protein
LMRYTPTQVAGAICLLGHSLPSGCSLAGSGKLIFCDLPSA